MVYNVLDIANKLLARAYNSEVEELMSNMKLQKMLYYEQGFHLAKFGTPLFDDEIEAWMYGPVVPKVYNHYKENGSMGIVPNGEVVELQAEEDVYNTDDLLQLVDLLNERFGEYKNFKVYNHILFNDDHILTDEQIDCHYKLSNKIVSSSLSSKPKLLSGPKAYSCMADSPTSRVITPDGKFGKCEHYSSEYLVGSLDGNDIDNEMLYKWAERYGRQEACDSCPLYPVCVRIKMCPNDSPVCYEFDKEKEISMIKRAMLMAYEDYRKSKS